MKINFQEIKFSVTVLGIAFLIVAVPVFSCSHYYEINSARPFTTIRNLPDGGCYWADSTHLTVTAQGAARMPETTPLYKYNQAGTHDVQICWVSDGIRSWLTLQQSYPSLEIVDSKGQKLKAY